ncbi:MULTISPECIES: hypothetical protein [Rhodanobacteraceae]|uniref:hypothetical protein n=1 Tax=Rhodanobacteraceae TaxID=1775411 RepID=UPI000885A7EF|nr:MULTISPECIES: hypothetical protein [Rhodanobacteraceae]SDG44055.1 hypothetical protein SAMN04515659_2772 [Dyella sp. 333MFSha]SKB89912.1 hypothetical protein SAMN05660880_03136 [Luteibacter sp. 22Crub2.1]
MKYVIPGPRENPPARGNTGGVGTATSSYGGDIVKRIDRLETDSQFIRRDLDEIRGDTRAIKDQLHSMDKRLTVIEHSSDAGFRSICQKMDAGFAAVDQKFAAVYQKMDARFAAVDQKFAAVYQKMDAGFAAVDQQFAAVYQKMDAGFAAVDQKMDAGFAAVYQKMDANFSSIHQTLSTVPTKLQLALMALAGLAMILGSAFAVVAALLRSTGHAEVANVLDAARG